MSVVSVRQPQPLGLGHAVLCAKSVVGQDDFAVLLPDVLVKDSSGQNDLSRMISRYDESNAAQIMVEAVPNHLVDQYGIVDVAQSPNEGESIAMQGIIENLQWVLHRPIYLLLVVMFCLQKLCNYSKIHRRVRVMKFS